MMKKILGLWAVSTCVCWPALATEPDPITADPAAVAAHIALPAGVAIPDGGAVLVLSATHEALGARSHETYRLVALPDAGGFALSPADQVRLAQQQGVITEWMNAGIDVDGSMSFTIDPCLTGEDVPRRARVTIALRADHDSGFQTVVDDMRLQRVLGRPVTELEACAG